MQGKLVEAEIGTVSDRNESVELGPGIEPCIQIGAQSGVQRVLVHHLEQFGERQLSEGSHRARLAGAADTVRPVLLELDGIVRVVLLHQHETAHTQRIRTLEESHARLDNVANARRRERALIAEAVHQIGAHHA